MKRIIKLIIASVLLCNPLDLKEEMKWGNDLHTGFLKLCQIFLEIEKEFGLEFTEEEADDIKTVGDLVDYVKTHSGN